VFIYDDPDENKFFDHWEDGSTNPTRTITPLLDTTLTAFFQTDSASTSTVSLLVESADISGTVFPGQWVELWQNGEIIQEDFTPFSVDIDADTQYEIFIYDDPDENKFFDQWDDGNQDQKRKILTSADIMLTALFQTEPTQTNNPPGASDDFAQTEMNVSVNIDVLANDSDPDGDELFVSDISIWPENGDVTIDDDGTVTYTPFDGFVGTDMFDYEVSDGNGGTDTALVTVDVIETTILPITKTDSGLIAFDLLNNETQTRQQLEAEQGFWHYSGSALNPTVFSPPAPTDLFKDSEGLHIGVETPTNGTYAGFFAVTNHTDATLFHAKISTPVRTISGDFFQNGLYVQTGDGRINYVTCVSVTSTAGTSWHIVRTFGNSTQATEFEVLWSDMSANQPLSRDCTIVTNGNNYLKVYLDGIKVYENNSIDLQMPGPYLYFLEPQNSHTEMLYGIYKDYYATKNEFVQVVNNPPDAKLVKIIDTDGNIVANSQVSAGNATIDVGSLHFPVIANIKVLDANGNEIASTTTTQNVYGGDVFSIDSD
jgi:hypothetical protein